MAISVNYQTRVIFVPKADLTLIQASPVEVRELDLNWFRLKLKDWEDEQGGMVMPNTHNHVAPIEVGGVTLARVVELINGYTVTFEDGQYAVNLAGANSNVGDRVNVNQVSVRSANSAGLLQTREIQYASFEGGVWVDTLATTSGTIYPAGTRRAPVNNLADAQLIANLYGFSTFFVLGDLLIDSGNFESMSFVGESKNKTAITIDSGANVLKCEFYEAHMDGVLDGNCVLKDCVVDSVQYVSGFIESCVLEGTVTLGGNQTAHFLDCYSGVPGSTTPTIDCGGDGPSLAIRNFNGGVKLVNKTGNSPVSVDLNSGQIILETTVTAGEIVIRGVGKLTNLSQGATVKASDLIQGSKLLTIAKFLGLK